MVAREQAAPFEWGRHDCATLAVAVVHAMTGHDIAADVPPWFSALSAVRSLRRAGHESAWGFFVDRLPEIPLSEARRGDLVYAAAPVGVIACPAVLTGAEAMSRDEQGWLVFPRSLAIRAFKVG